MAVNINWNQLQTPDFGGNALQYAQAGQQMRQEQAKRNALAQYAQDPEAAVSGLLAAGDVQGANALQQFGAQQAVTKARTAAAPLVAQGKYGEAAKGVAGVSPEYAAQLLKLDDAQRAAVSERAGVLGSAAYSLKALPKEQRAAAAQRMAPQLADAGVPPDKLANFDFSDENLDLVIGQAMTLKDQIAQANTDRTFTAGREDAAQRQADRLADNERADRAQKERELADAAREGRLLAAVGGGGGRGQGKAPSGYRWNADGGLEPIPGGPADRKDGVGDAKTEMTLRKEFDALPEVKNYRTVANAAKQVRALATAPPSANNDIALIYSVMKAYDPTSVVRETEFATAQNAAGVPDKIKNQWNKVLKGQRLNPTQRAEMAQAVSTVARASGDRFATIADNYRTYAAQAGGNPDHIVKYERKTTRTGSAPAASASAPKVMRFDAQGNLVK